MWGTFDAGDNEWHVMPTTDEGMSLAPHVPRPDCPCCPERLPVDTGALYSHNQVH